ncbi:DUF397 domain-containing protein [Streptomyces dysideae]|uniref:Toxin-antitoxin system, toxin component domain protein n=1 Tax=Streptomyces dysideae TaxID=909626 RepID=A0A101UX33_9ACTN|nr:DUF397 domain-containing protein [Streptomyces dysideae]KUO18458.1 toxin-antitoxin system, toxin component domain protein [Streptomyces dysideae]
MTTPLAWQKSSFSGGGTGDECVELALPTASPTSIQLRESDTPTAVLTTNRTALHALLTTVKNSSNLTG